MPNFYIIFILKLITVHIMVNHAIPDIFLNVIIEHWFKILYHEVFFLYLL